MPRRVIEDIRPGVLNDTQIGSLAKNGYIRNLDLGRGEIDKSAFDLHISGTFWEMHSGAIKPLPNEPYSQITDNPDLATRKNIRKNGSVILKKATTYVFRLKEELNLKRTQIFGVATGRSSIGRLDILTRLIVDKCSSYDCLTRPHSGPLYLEVTPISFKCRIKEGTALSQLRLFKGKPELSEIDGRSIGLYGLLILDENRKRKKAQEINYLRVNLRNLTIAGRRTCGFESLEDVERAVDLTQDEGCNEPSHFWRRCRSHKRSGYDVMIVQPEHFYIFRSKEQFKLPNDIAVYAQAISEDIGEIRIHYAGFVHPLFGLSRKNGTPIVFEIRGHNVKTLLRDGEVLAKIKFYRLSEPATEPTSDGKKRGNKRPLDTRRKSGYARYIKQRLKLSTYFRPWKKR